MAGMDVGSAAACLPGCSSSKGHGAGASAALYFVWVWGMPSPVSLQLSNKERRRCHTVDGSEVLHLLHAKADETWDIPQASSGDRRISEPWTVSNTRPVAVCYIDGMVDCISTRNWWSCCINTWPGEEHSLGCIRRIWLTEKYIFWNHGTIGCTPDSVPLLFIVCFFWDSWTLWPINTHY